MSFKDFVNAVSFSSRFNKLKEVISQPTRDEIYPLTDFLEQQDIVDTYVADYLRSLCQRQQINFDPLNVETLVFPKELKIKEALCKTKEDVYGIYHIEKDIGYYGFETAFYERDEETALFFTLYYSFMDIFILFGGFLKNWKSIGTNRKSICNFNIENRDIDSFMQELPSLIDKEKAFNFLMFNYLNKQFRDIVSKPYY